MQELEKVADSFEGVDKSFAIQAGREIRLIVKPDKISDNDMVILARDVAKKIEDKQLTVTEKTFKDACSVAGITCKGSKESKTDGIVIGIVFGVLILGFAGLIVLSRKK